MAGGFFPILFFSLVISGGWAQKISIVLGPSPIGKNEFYTITLSAQDQGLDEYSNFPNIPGFDKAGISSMSSSSSINGRTSNQTNLIQNYMPTKEGTFKLPPFSMKVNGQVIKSPGGNIVVTAPVDNRSSDPFGANPFSYDPFEDFYNKSTNANAKTDAFFSIQTDKKEVWAGEGVNVTLSFLAAEDNQTELEFVNPGGQLEGFIKKIKPANCWEENFGIDRIEPRRVKIGSKIYNEYRFYQATLFPLVAKSFTIPALKLDMLKLKNAGFFGASGDEEVKSFYSKPITIKVKPLPNHPLKGKAPVGVYKLEETLAKRKVAINQGVAYDLKIKGEGNISYLSPPEKTTSEMLDIYPPNTQQTIQRSAGRVTGEKIFSYLLVPKEAGEVSLARTFFMVYFDTQKGRYDTLRPSSKFSVVEGKAASASTSAKAEDSFYSLIDKADKSQITLGQEKTKNLFWINIGMALMAVVTLVLSFLRR